MMQRILTLAMVATALTACAVGPDYDAPALRLPTEWLGLGMFEKDTPAPVGDLAWWKNFNDPVLDRLVDDALAANGDLKVALANVKEARAARMAATSALLPQIDGNANIARGDVAAAGVRTTSLASLDASWEIDLFGGGRRARQAAVAGVGAADAAYRFAKVSLLAEVARTYLDVRQLQKQVDVTGENLRIQAETLRIVNVQAREGVASRFDVARIEGQVAATRALLPLAQQNLTAAVNRLGILTGKQPQEILVAVMPVKDVPVATPALLAATPATVIAARPDVAQAERLLAQATANQGVAISNWFPRLSLTGLFGLADSSVAASREVWQAGGAVTLPIINFGAVRAIVRTANARQEAALASYEQTVLAALADVETVLDAYVQSQVRLNDLRAAVTARREAMRLADLRYKEGTVALLEVLQVQQELLEAESSLATGEAAVGQALAAVYTATGGMVQEEVR